VDFVAVLDQVIALLRQRGRLTYRTLQRQFQLDEAALEDLKVELIEGQRLAMDERGTVLVWTGAAAAPSALTAVPAPASVPLGYTPPYLAEKILTSRRALEGERKQVTVLFADLKGSMELLADRDPEEARQLLDPVLERLMAAVHRYEGTVNQIMGDGIMALFGAPLAHEDHAVRACYAALAMQEAIRSYADQVRQTHQVEIQIRVGLNSGEVVVRAIGNDLHMDYSAIGQTTHLAARMEQLATPGSILLTTETLRLAEGIVQVKPLGPTPVRGLREPLEVWELVGAGSPRTRLQAFAARTHTRFVGRQAEVEALRQAHALAGAGHGQLVAVVGEPGVGKTRLLYEFLCAPWTQGWLLLESHAASYSQATPYHPIRELLKTYFQLGTRDDAGQRRKKVTDKLRTLDPALAPILPAVLTLFDVPVDDRTWQALEPPQRRQRTLDALTRLLVRESQVQPVLLVCDNLHWLDTETQAFLESLVDSLPTVRLLLLVNYRPEYHPPWGSLTSYVHLRLDPLPPTSTDELVQALLGDDPSLAPLTPLLMARTAGNPFFLEESVRTLVETGHLGGEPGAYRLAQPLHTLHVPATVQAVLAARIDRLPPEEKQLLQTAAVIGTEVSLVLLQAIAEVPEAPLRLGLTHLQAAEFLYETRLFPDLVYTFKHALTQQVAYETLLQERRRALHARIVEALEAFAGDRLAEQIERLAHHALRGRIWDKALAYSRQAGEKAMARSAYREAVAYFEQALRVLPHLPETRETREQAIDLRLALRSALRPLGAFERILAALHEAESLAAALNDPRRLGQVSVSLSLHFYLMGAYDQAIAAAQRALARDTVRGDVVLYALANLRLGLAYQAQGDCHGAIDCYRQTVASLAGEQRYERFGFPLLISVNARAHLAVCHAELGAFAEGCALGDEGLRIAEVVAHPGSLMYASCGMGLVALHLGDFPRALLQLERAMSLCHEADLPAYFPWIAVALGMAYTLGGRLGDAVPLLTQAMEQSTAMDVVFLQALCHLALGEAQGLAGRLEEAHALAERALALANRHQERGNEAYALHLLGEIAAHRVAPDVDAAAASYRQALTLAEELGMRPLQAHCHRGLGMLDAATGQQAQARTELSTAIAMYTSMDMTFWLPQTETALARVDA
jgi:class 3 adenylate cyclase/tetratricopeptide (TPR) repeat protein